MNKHLAKQTSSREQKQLKVYDRLISVAMIIKFTLLLSIQKEAEERGVGKRGEGRGCC